MTIQKWIVRIHKWIALIVGLQIVLWIAGGLVMSAIPIEIVRGEHKIEERSPVLLNTETLLPIASAAEKIGSSAVTSAKLGEMLGTPVWRIVDENSKTVIVDAETGDILSPLNETLARQIAEHDYNGEAASISVKQLDKPPTEYNKPGPVWRVGFDDRDKTTIYVDPSLGEVTARRSETWRFFDFFWKLHVMDYDDGADFNHPLLITAAGMAVFVSLSGFILLIIKMRRSLILWKSNRRKEIKKSTNQQIG